MISKDRDGRCYALAIQFFNEQIEIDSPMKLIHGSIKKSNGSRIKHAWVLTDAGFIYEPVRDSFYEPDEFKKVFAPIIDNEYGIPEVFGLSTWTEHAGPWSQEEKQDLADYSAQRGRWKKKGTRRLLLEKKKREYERGMRDAVLGST
jgi:hypothetical protein